MKKIRVVHYCNQLSLGGTERTMELFCKYLDRDRFDVFVVSMLHRVSFRTQIPVTLAALIGKRSAQGKQCLWKTMNARIPKFISILGPDRIFLARNQMEVRDHLLKLSPDILHVHYSGNPEPPTSDKIIMTSIPVTVTTNQFEKENTASSHQHVKRILFPSNWLLKNKAIWAHEDKRAVIFPNPVELPASTENLRHDLGIAKDAFVIGRVGRPDDGIYDPISLRAYQSIQNEKTYFLAIAPPPRMVRDVTELRLKNVILLPSSTDDVYLSKFYNSINVLAHARRDGETFGCNLAEAMIHAKPVISHWTLFMNAQAEVIGDAGFVCKQDDHQEYAARLLQLRDDRDLYSDLARRARTRALENFEARMLTKRLEKDYSSLLVK